MTYSAPDAAAPTIVDAVLDALNRAMTRGRAPSGAIIGGIERIAGALNARNAPKAPDMTKNGHTAVGFDAE